MADECRSSTAIAQWLTLGWLCFPRDRNKWVLSKSDRLWNRDYSSHNAYTESVEPNRARLARTVASIHGYRRGSTIGHDNNPHSSRKMRHYTVSRVRWQVFDDGRGQGLLLESEA